MNETLRLLYDKFYTPLPMVESEQEVEICHRQLIERLDKPERKLVLQIIGAQNLMIVQRSVDSFICGFRLAWELANELNHFEPNRHPSPEEETEMDACFYPCLIARVSLSRYRHSPKPVSERSMMVSGICLRYFRPKLVVPKYASKFATGSTTQSESSGLLAK